MEISNKEVQKHINTLRGKEIQKKCISALRSEEIQKFISALRKCAKEHENDTTCTGNIAVSNLCKDTAKLLERLEQKPCADAISRQYLLDNCVVDKVTMPYVPVSKIKEAPPVTPKPKTSQRARKAHIKGKISSMGFMIPQYQCPSCRTPLKCDDDSNICYCYKCGCKVKIS